MFSRKRILYLGSISILLLSGLMFVAHAKLTPTAHAASCTTIANGYYGFSGGTPSWGSNCDVSETQNADTNFVSAIQVIVNGSGDLDGQNGCPDQLLAVDGDFGQLTLAAVECLQTVERQSYTGGTVGMITWNNLADELCYQSTNGDWINYSTCATSSYVDFRVYNNSSQYWYVNTAPSGDPANWCRMDTSDSCN